MSQMKLGFVAFPSPPEEYISLAAAQGANHLEIDLFGPAQWLELFHAARIRDLAKRLEDAGLTCSFHTPYVLNLADYLPSVRRSAVEYMIRLLNVAKATGALWVTCHPGYGLGIPTLNWVRPRAVDCLKRSLEILLPLAEKLKLPIALENINPSVKGSQIVHLMDHPDEMAGLFKAFPSDSLRACIDIGHARLSGDWTAFLQDWRDRCIAFHIHDNDGVQDLHLVPGKGVIDWQKVLRLLIDTTPNAALNVELFSDDDKVDALEYLKGVLEALGHPWIDIPGDRRYSDSGE